MDQASTPDNAPALDTTPDGEEQRLVAALRGGDEAAFVRLVEQYHPLLVRLAQLYVSDRAVAEEVAQESWLGLLQGLERFEQRSSLKTWLCRIVTNRAKTRGQREGRSIPFSALAGPDDDDHEPAVAPERFRSSDPHQGHWASPPTSWTGTPEERLLAGETQAVIQQAITALPASQRTVITLRDIKGWSAAETCDSLGLTEANQRVLLHRARARVRRALEHYLHQP